MHANVTSYHLIDRNATSYHSIDRDATSYHSIDRDATTGIDIESVVFVDKICRDLLYQPY